MSQKGWCLKKNGEVCVFENKGYRDKGVMRTPLVRGSRHGDFPVEREVSCELLPRHIPNWGFPGKREIYLGATGGGRNGRKHSRAKSESRRALGCK